MQKEDLRHRNNTTANKNLHIELDLWLMYVENNKEPVLIGTAISKENQCDGVYKLYYSPSDICKTCPFLLTFEKVGEFESTRFETIASAKYYLRKSDYAAKWKNSKL